MWLCVLLYGVCVGVCLCVRVCLVVVPKYWVYFESGFRLVLDTGLNSLSAGAERADSGEMERC